MNTFQWRDGRLHADEVALETIADVAGTPTYVYSASAIRTAYRRLENAFSPIGAQLHFSVKACPNIHISRLLLELGSGMDVVSGAELERVWFAGAPMDKIVFAGVGKSEKDIAAALDGRFSPLRGDLERLGIQDPADRGPVGMFNVESESELERISAVAARVSVRARFCLRVNPNVDPQTHEYTTTGKGENKFGIDADKITGIIDRWANDPWLDFQGLHVHIGSPVPKVEPYAEAIQVLLTVMEDIEARGHQIRVFNFGGGWPVAYEEGAIRPIEEYGEHLVPLLKERADAGMKIYMEPGRSLVANSALLLTRVEYVKKGRMKTFVICDSGMHNLIRPALYRAFHFVWPVNWQGPAPKWTEDPGLDNLTSCDLVGPICETGDFLARDRRLPEVEQGDLMAIFSAGAYGMAMSSNYNGYGRPAEVLIDGDRAMVINERQPLGTLLETEKTARPVVAESQAISD